MKVKCKSVLDYIIIDQEDEAAAVKMVIDEEKEFAPAKHCKNKEITTSDHNSILSTFNWTIDTKITEQPRKLITKKGYMRIKEEMKERNLSEIFKKD